MSKSNAISAEVSGLKELDKAIKQFNANIQLKVLAGAVRESAKPVLNRAKQNLNRISANSSGSVRESMMIKKASKKASGNSVKYFVAPNEKSLVAAATYLDYYGRGGSGIFHAQWIELGIPSRGIKARPFLRPAGDSAAGESSQSFIKGLNRGVNRETRKAARLSK